MKSNPGPRADSNRNTTLWIGSRTRNRQVGARFRPKMFVSASGCMLLQVRCLIREAQVRVRKDGPRP